MLELLLLLDFSDNAYVANVMLPLKIKYLIYFCLMQFFVSSGRLLHISDNHTLFFCNVQMSCFPGVLRILTEMFLPHISLADLEQTFFSKVLPKV